LASKCFAWPSQTGSVLRFFFPGITMTCVTAGSSHHAQAGGVGLEGAVSATERCALGMEGPLAGTRGPVRVRALSRAQAGCQGSCQRLDKTHQSLENVGFARSHWHGGRVKMLRTRVAPLRQPAQPGAILVQRIILQASDGSFSLYFRGLQSRCSRAASRPAT
jgi:hypothetical protein